MSNWSLQWTECFCPQPPNSHIEILTPSGMVLGGRVLGSDWVMKSKPSQMELVPLRKGPQVVVSHPLSTCKNTARSPQ